MPSTNARIGTRLESTACSDALMTEAPPVEVAWSQKRLDAPLGGPKLRGALVMTSSGAMKVLLAEFAHDKLLRPHELGAAVWRVPPREEGPSVRKADWTRRRQRDQALRM